MKKYKPTKEAIKNLTDSIKKFGLVNSKQW